MESKVTPSLTIRDIPATPTTHRHRTSGFAGRIGALTMMIAGLGPAAGVLRAQNLVVPNGSFETPSPPPGFPATPQVDAWQKGAQPPGIPLPGGVTWDQLAGVFPNTPVGSPDHIDNLDGNQAAYILAIPGVSLYQDLDARYEVGKSYTFTLGLLGGGGITEGTTLELSLYYRDSANNPVTVAAASISYNSTDFPTITHLMDRSVSVPEVKNGDLWAGDNLGVQVLLSSGTGAGYWDADSARLEAIPEPSAATLLMIGGSALLLRGVGRRRSR